jgi:hypothetical protein
MYCAFGSDKTLALLSSAWEFSTFQDKHDQVIEALFDLLNQKLI